MSVSPARLRGAVDELARTGRFDEVALAVFAYQRAANPTYRRFLRLLGYGASQPSHWSQAPGMPIDLFRAHDVRSGDWTPAVTFTSSGTTGAATSRHPVRSREGYVRGCVRTFERLTGRALGEFRLLALLPSYLEREGSGLVTMIDGFLRLARPGSGFFLRDHEALRASAREAAAAGEPVLLWGVTYALLDLTEPRALSLPPGSLVVETGGMKGTRRELTREELHERLSAKLILTDGMSAPLLSEYGMTEMQSQAYLLPTSARFLPAPALRVAAREITDPFALCPYGKTGALNVIDLANLDTVAFVQTDDLGRVYADGSFDVLGRQDGARARGCNLLAAE